MKDVNGKTAFITGGASGIGLGIARSLAAAGMKVVITDVEEAALVAAAEQVAAESPGGDAALFTQRLDVTDRKSYHDAAEAAEAHFGNIHVVCLNAGVSWRGPLESVSYDDWDWVIGVNLFGVINGVKTFAQRVRSHGEGGHFVITASMAGLLAGVGNGVYNTAKFGAIGLAETLRAEMASYGVGVSALCPGAVKTNINNAARNRPERLSDAGNYMTAEQEELMAKSFEHGTEPRHLGDMVLKGIIADSPYILPHREFIPAVKQRFETILASFTDEPEDPARVADNQFRRASFAKFWDDGVDRPVH
jgi:NAD(P)-dependent dehydrogenase (short-subunit alcohol dehydrogenase family)